MSLTSETQIQNEGFVFSFPGQATAAFGSKNNRDVFIRKMDRLTYLPTTNTLPTTYFFRQTVKGVFSSLEE